MRHRHLDVGEGTPPQALGAAAIDDLLDRGDLEDWRPLLAEVRRDPWGAVAGRVLQLVEHHPMYGTARLWRSWIEEQRSAAPAPHAGEALRTLRRARGLTQRQVAERLEMTQPEISKLERRRDVRLSTARAYIGALGGRMGVVARFDDGEVELEERAGRGQAPT
ncbi:MAG TPA: helix-turn-helix transcriptional regulator [Gaiellaceae bacterium]